jgi:hypothetical protein
MKPEAQPRQPNFEFRKAGVAKIGKSDLVKYQGVTLENVFVDNQFFPHFLYGIDTNTQQSVAIELNDHEQPQILNREKLVGPKLGEQKKTSEHSTKPSTKSQESGGDFLNRNLKEIVQATGDPYIGLLTKVYTEGGMSSQLIKRYDAQKRGGKSKNFYQEKKIMKNNATN